MTLCEGERLLAWEDIFVDWAPFSPQHLNHVKDIQLGLVFGHIMEKVFRMNDIWGLGGGFQKIPPAFSTALLNETQHANFILVALFWLLTRLHADMLIWINILKSA